MSHQRTESKCAAQGDTHTHTSFLLLHLTLLSAPLTAHTVDLIPNQGSVTMMTDAFSFLRYNCLQIRGDAAGLLEEVISAAHLGRLEKDLPEDLSMK